MSLRMVRRSLGAGLWLCARLERGLIPIPTGRRLGNVAEPCDSSPLVTAILLEMQYETKAKTVFRQSQAFHTAIADSSSHLRTVIYLLPFAMVDASDSIMLSGFDADIYKVRVALRIRCSVRLKSIDESSHNWSAPRMQPS